MTAFKNTASSFMSVSWHGRSADTQGSGTLLFSILVGVSLKINLWIVFHLSRTHTNTPTPMQALAVLITVVFWSERPHCSMKSNSRLDLHRSAFVHLKLHIVVYIVLDHRSHLVVRNHNLGLKSGRV